MDEFECVFSKQELEDIRAAVMRKYLDFDDSEQEKIERFAALSDKLARISVLGHA